MKKLSATKKLTKFYEKNVSTHGPNENGAGWGSSRKHNIRLKAIISFYEKHSIIGHSLLDIGCGYGQLLKIINKKFKTNPFKYIGIDSSPKMISFAKENFPNEKFFNVSLENFSEKKVIDHIVCCGIFTKKINASKIEMYQLLEKLIKKTKSLKAKSLTFNTMSPFCDSQTKDLFFPKMDKIIDLFEKEYNYKIKYFDINNKHLRYEIILHFRFDK